MAGPGSRNYIIRGLVSYGEEVIFPGTIDGDPVTSFLPSSSLSGNAVYPGIKKLRLPDRLGRFIERNDVFPDLELLEVDPENRIFSTDGRMLYRDEGAELWLSLSEGMSGGSVTVPYSVKRLGPCAFTGTGCREIIFENPWIEAEDTSFDGSEWLFSRGPEVYVGNMLYRVKTGSGERTGIFLKKETKRIHKNAFSGTAEGAFIRVILPYGMQLPGLTDALTEGMKKRNRGLLTVSTEDGKRELPLPLSLDREGAELLRKTLDLGDDCISEIFPHINSTGEKLDFALFAASGEDKANEGLYRQVIGSNEEKAAERAALILDEDRICSIIKNNYIGREAFLRILPTLQDKGMVSAAANVLIMGSRGREE